MGLRHDAARRCWRSRRWPCRRRRPPPARFRSTPASRAALEHQHQGQIVGGGDLRASFVLWKQGAGKTPLAGVSVASAINDSRDGRRKLHPGGNPLCGRRRADGRARHAEGERYRFAWASDVNEHSQVVGKARDNLMTNPTDRAILWTPEGSMVDLGSLPGRAHRHGRRDQRQWPDRRHQRRAGQLFLRGRAFLWTQAGGMADLGTLPDGDYSQAKAINNSGQVVGEAGHSLAVACPLTRSCGRRRAGWSTSARFRAPPTAMPMGSTTAARSSASAAVVPSCGARQPG